MADDFSTLHGQSTASVPLPLTRASEFVHVAEAAELVGVSSATVCRRLGLPFWYDCDPSGFVPTEHLVRFKDGVARAAGSAALGLALYDAVPFERLGTVGTAIARAANVYQALTTGVRLMRCHVNSSWYYFVERDDVVWLCRRAIRFKRTAEDAHNQYSLRGMIQVVQFGAGEAWWPERIILQGDGPAAMPPPEALRGVRVQWHPSVTAIVVPRDVLPLPLRGYSAAPRLDLPSADELHYLRTAPSDTLIGALKQLIASMIGHGRPSLETVAEIAGAHPRTLQRALRRQSTSYRELVDEVCAERAMLLLEADGVPVTEIAFDLGYTDVSHFIRAFRRWTGVSPGRYRRVRLAA